MLLQLARQLRREVHPLGVTGGQVSLLVAIKQSPGIGVRELAAREGISPAGMSGHVDRLEAARLVRRAAVGGDKRRVGLELTDAGMRVHRLDPRRTVIATQTFAMALAAALAALALSGVVEPWQVYVIGFLAGTVQVLDAPARQALTYRMVGPAELPNAVALNSSLFNGARIFGPGLGGLLVAAVGAGYCFLANAGCFCSAPPASAWHSCCLRPLGRSRPRSCCSSRPGSASCSGRPTRTRSCSSKRPTTCADASSGSTSMASPERVRSAGSSQAGSRAQAGRSSRTRWPAASRSQPRSARSWP